MKIWIHAASDPKIIKVDDKTLREGMKYWVEDFNLNTSKFVGGITDGGQYFDYIDIKKAIDYAKKYPTMFEDCENRSDMITRLMYPDNYKKINYGDYESGYYQLSTENDMEEIEKVFKKAGKKLPKSLKK